MAKKQNSGNDSFRSIQILSAKAQSLWTKAKTRMQTQDSKFTKQPVMPSEQQKARSVTTVDVSGYTVAKVIITFLLLNTFATILFVLRDKIILLLLACFIAIVIDANVRWLERWRVPRALAVILIYFAFLAVAVFLLISLIPIVATQLQDIARYINNSADAFLLNPHFDISFISQGMNERLTAVTQDMLQQMGIKDRASALFQFGQNLSLFTQGTIDFAVKVTGGVFNFIVTLILILVLSFFIQMEREKISDFLRSVLPREFRGYYDAKAEAVYLKISQWFRGQLILCVAIGSLVFIALKILGMPYAHTLGLLAGFTEFIPYAGPIIGALPAILIALSQYGFVWAAVVAVMYYIIQICENNLLVPLIMKHAVGLSPIAIIFGMLVGVSFPGTVHPVVGIILAVPTTAIITIFVHDFYLMRRRK